MTSGFDIMNKSFSRICDTFDENKGDTHEIMVADDREAIADRK